MTAALDDVSTLNVTEGTAVIVLAAGASTRLGSPKQLALLNREPLLVRAVRLAAAAGVHQIVAVLGANADAIAHATEAHPAWPSAGVELIVNHAWPEGMASSIRCGVDHLSKRADITGLLVMTCDQPLITPGHLAALSRHDPGSACGTAYAGRKGVPAYFPRGDFDRLLELRGDAGARDWLRTLEAISFEDAAFDADCAADLEALRERAQTSGS